MNDRTMVSIALPTASVRRLDGKHRNRTKLVNEAVAMYLDVQGPAKNRYGADCAYFKGRMQLLMRDMDNFRPDELARELARMSRTADAAVMHEAEFARP